MSMSDRSAASPARLLTIAEALEVVRTHAHPLEAVRVPLVAAWDCALAEPIRADRDSPPFDKALMDGYAIRSADAGDRRDFEVLVVEEIPAGMVPSRQLGQGESALIMTGAPLPEGADAVVPREWADDPAQGRQTDRPLPRLVRLRPLTPVVPGVNVMVRGREMTAGEQVLTPPIQLTAVRLGLLASLGVARPWVTRRPRLIVVPTGDELVEPDQPPGPGRIRNSNAFTLAALARRAGAAPRIAPIVPDRLDDLREALRQALDWADVVLVTGGVSAGDRDLVPAALESLGVRTLFHKVHLKPGKPLLFGVGPERTAATSEAAPDHPAAFAPGPDRPPALVFGLPGNPVSGIVGFLLFVQPALRLLSRCEEDGTTESRNLQVRLATQFTHRGDRPTYHPARFVAQPHLVPSPHGLDQARQDQGGPWVEPLAWAGSADLRTLAQADGFVVFEPGDAVYPIGASRPFLSL